MGVVYSAVHEKLGRPVAIKVLRKELSDSTDLSSRFQMEAELVTRIGHPNIVAVYDFGRTQSGSLYYVMEMIRGQSLRSRLDKRQLTPLEIVQVFGPLLSAVRAAHEIGVVHRDLKPDNVMLLAGAEGSAGTVKLLDFGIAKIRVEKALGEPTITGFEDTDLDKQRALDAMKAAAGTASASVTNSRSIGSLATSIGSVLGTPAYMAPEQVQNSSTVDKRADVYAIGIMLYEALACRRPFEAESSAELMGAHMYMKAEPPSKTVQKHQVPDRQLDWAKLDPVVMRALAKKPEDRYQDCSGLQADLEAAWGQSFSIARGGVLSAGSSAAMPTPSPAVVQPKPSRSKLILAVVAAVALAGGGASLVLFKGGKQQAGQARLDQAEAQIKKALTGVPGERRVLMETIKAVASRAHLAAVAQGLGDDDPSVSRAALQAVLVLGRPGDAQLSEPLSVLAGQAVGSASVDIAAAQLRIGESEAQSVLTAMLQSPIPTPEARLRAAVVLAEAGQLQAVALRQALTAALRAQLTDPGLRREALVRLAVLRDAEALRQLEDATRQPATGPTKDAHLEALQVLTLAKQAGAAEKLQKISLSVVPLERVGLAEVLAEVLDPKAVSVLLPLLGDSQPKVKQRALASLGRLASRGLWLGYTDTLIPLLNDADSQVALTAAVTLVAASAASTGSVEARP